ncbi:hypothetical protein BDZ91DRAFT_696548 [Kalaharituber pfeilii]|nr:hypothetical protein BDZ91DRAFT_696548 [Kalaharituber pfeilii]
MWEDNNPLSYDRRSSTSSFAPTDAYGSSPPSFLPSNIHNQHQGNMASHISEQDEDEPRAASRDPSSHGIGDDTDDDDDDYPAAMRSVGYDSRLEKILAEHKDLGITIVGSGKNAEGSGGGYIYYTIRTGDLEVRRRYSEFESLRRNLTLLFPCLIIPPIPEKHSLSDYATAPRHAKEDIHTIDLRKRMLGVFLNRCLRMKEIRRCTVFAKFLDPNASWSEVLNSPPISDLPKSYLRAPPNDPSHPTPAHAFLPIPSGSAKLRTVSMPAAAANPYMHRFPPQDHTLTEAELDHYFSNYEIATKDYESLLTGSIEKVNRRILKRLTELATDYSELGARYNAFSLFESGTLASAIERIGQSVDSTYIATEELARLLTSSFAEPLRESAQFAGVVRGVLKYRLMKRLQEEMTRDQLAQKKQLLEELERSEAEARRIEQCLIGEASTHKDMSDDHDEVEIIDPAEFPPTHMETPSTGATASPKRSQSTKSPQGSLGKAAGRNASGHRKSASAGVPSSNSTSTSPSSSGGIASSFVGGVGNGLSSKIFGRLSHAVHGIVDVDPETTRRNNIGKNKERLQQLEQALHAAEGDVKEATNGILKDLRRFQKEKEEDLKRMMIAYAKCHIEWAKKNYETWEEAKAEVEKIQAR